MRKIREIGVLSMLATVAVFGLAACGDTPKANTPIPVVTVAATSQPTTAMEATTEPTGMVGNPTVEPTAMTVATTAPTIMVEPTAMTQPTTSSGGGLTITGPGADLLSKSFQVYKDVKSYHFVEESTASAGGASVSTKSEGDFQAPDRYRRVTEVGPTKSQVIIIGQDVYTQQPLSDAYLHVVAPGTTAMDLKNASILPLIQSADIIGDETIDGVATTHLKYTYDSSKLMADASSQVGQPTPAMPNVTQGIVTIELWIDKATNFPIKEKIDTPVTSTTQTRSKFNEPVNPPIEKPANVTEMPGIPDIPTITIPTIVIPEIPTVVMP